MGLAIIESNSQKIYKEMYGHPDGHTFFVNSDVFFLNDGCISVKTGQIQEINARRIDRRAS